MVQNSKILKLTGIKSFFYCRWFDGFNWEGLRLRNLQQPITPKIQGHLDTSNFDDYPMDADGPPAGYFQINFKLKNDVHFSNCNNEAKLRFCVTYIDYLWQNIFTTIIF